VSQVGSENSGDENGDGQVTAVKTKRADYSRASKPRERRKNKDAALNGRLYNGKKRRKLRLVGGGAVRGVERNGFIIAR